MNNVNDALFQPHDLGTLTLPNRVLMSPLTRSRSSQPGDCLLYTSDAADE